MSMPPQIRDEVSQRLWRQADEIGWLHLSQSSKSRHYDNWTNDPAIGGRLGRFLDVKQIRHYIKDAVLKRYCRARASNASGILRELGFASDEVPIRQFIKPHGCQLANGWMICWGRANTWKLALLTLHERCFAEPGSVPFAAVLTQAAAQFGDEPSRYVVEDAAKKLGIIKVHWLAH